MQKVISFSLWGTNPKYTVGAVRNAQLCPVIYPGWVARFYVGSTVPAEVLQRLRTLGAEIIEMAEPGNFRSALWRFAAAADPSVEAMLSRDCDSRVNLREAFAVQQWLSSPALFHIMRDHPAHDVPILAGLWGAKSPLLREMTKLIEGYTKDNSRQVDQHFLRDVIYPRVKKVALVHDEFYAKRTFPEPRSGLEFVGQVFDEHDRPLPIDQEALAHGLNIGRWRAAWRRLRLR